MNLFDYLGKHTAEAGSWTVDFNDHNSVYETAKQVIESYEAYKDVGPWLDFETPELRQKAIDTNNIYYLQWYINTPVGFLSFAAPTLDDLARWVCKENPRSG